MRKELLIYSLLLCVGIVFIGVSLFSLVTSATKSNPLNHTAVLHNQASDILNSAKWGIAFSDEFNETSLDSSKWVTCYDWRLAGSSGCTNSGNNEQEWYQPSHVMVHNGVATLTATYDPITITQNGVTTVYPYQSGMISTGRPNATGSVKWSGTYGYYVARMKVDGGQGVWPAFWLLPTNQKWPPEIDIMELLGGKPNQIVLTSHWANASSIPQENSSTIVGPNFTQGWHTYAVNWQPGRIDWYIDGRLEKSVTGSTVPSQPMEIIIDLAVGGKLPGDTNSTTPFPRTAEIDYVRVYGLKL